MTVNDKHMPKCKPSPSGNIWKPEPHDLPVDLVKWQQSPVAHGAAYGGMTVHTSIPLAPRALVRTDGRKLARLDVINHLFMHLEYDDMDCKLTRKNPDSVFAASGPVSTTA